MCKIAKEISHLSWYFIRAYSISSYCSKYAQQCKLTQDMSTMLSQQHKLRDRIEGCHEGDQGSQPKSLASHYHPFHSTFASVFWRRIWIRSWRFPCHCRMSCSYHQRLPLSAQWASLEYRIEPWSNGKGSSRKQVEASWTCVKTCIGWPNGLAKFLASTRKYTQVAKKNTLRQTILYFIGW